MPKSTGVRAAQRAATMSRILAAARDEFAERFAELAAQPQRALVRETFV